MCGYTINRSQISLRDFLQTTLSIRFDHKMIFQTNSTSPIRTLASISIIWIVPSLLFYLLSYTNISTIFLSQTFSFLVIVFFIFLLSNTMAVFLKYDKDYLCTNNNIRRNLLIILIILRLLLFQIEHIDSFVGILAGITGTTTLIIFASLLGSYLSQAIKRLPELIPVCSVAFTVDLYSVLQGPSKEIALQIGEFYSSGAQGTVPYVDIILIKIPQLTVNYLTPIFGVSDWIFIVFFTTTLLKFRVSDSVVGSDITTKVGSDRYRFYFPLISIALLTSIFIAYILNIFVPALPVIIMIVLPWFIIKHPNLWKMRASDYYLTLIPPALAAIVYIV